MTLGSRAIADTPDARCLRDSAMAVIEQMLGHPDPDVQLAAIQVIADHGHCYGVPIGRHVPLDGKIMEETEKLAVGVGTLALKTPHLRVKSAAETQLLHFWAQEETVIAQVAAQHLRRLERSPEYCLLRSLVERYDVVLDFEDLERRAPCKDRWPWYVREVMNIAGQSGASHYEPVVAALAQRYVRAEDVVNLLAKMESVIKTTDRTKAPLLIHLWVKKTPMPFQELRSNVALWEQVPERFRAEIDVTLSLVDKRHLDYSFALFTPRKRRIR